MATIVRSSSPPAPEESRGGGRQRVSRHVKPHEDASELFGRAETSSDFGAVLPSSIQAALPNPIAGSLGWERRRANAHPAGNRTLSHLSASIRPKVTFQMFYRSFFHRWMTEPAERILLLCSLRSLISKFC